MYLHFEAQTDLDTLAHALSDLKDKETIKAAMILSCDANHWPIEQAASILKDSHIPVFGGIFPQITYKNRNYETGFLLVGLSKAPDIAIVEGLSDDAMDFDEAIADATDSWEELDTQSTMLVFVDGLSSRISGLIEGLFANFGLDDNFIGGGAGSLSFEKSPCVITPNGLMQDIAILARLPLYSSIGVTHGWQAISEGMKVTESDRNIIKTIDWKPAFSVYKEMVETHSGQEIREDNFFDMAKSYPFGIAKLDVEMVVRDPLMVCNDTELVCVGEVPEGCFVKLLNGTPQSLIEAAAQAREIAETGFTQDKNKSWFFIDCISRVLFLGERITEELDAVGHDTPVFGAFTLGEIANTGQDYLEFYNKTSVLGLLEQ